MEYVILAVFFFVFGFVVNKANVQESETDRIRREIYVPNYQDIMQAVPATHAHAFTDYLKAVVQDMFNSKLVNSME